MYTPPCGVTEPERETLAVAMQAMKQSVARQRVKVGGHFWQPRYYDFNVWSEKKRIEKLRYIHRNPVRRGLVENPEGWESTPPRARAARGGGPVPSSYRHYLTGKAGVVEIESHWTARARERLGWRPQVRIKRTTSPRSAGPRTLRGAQGRLKTLEWGTPVSDIIKFYPAVGLAGPPARNHHETKRSGWRWWAD
jgi:hypothetical protein